MNRFPASVSILALALALAGCKGEEKPAQDARAAGEILPGSASDAMVPYDTVRSQPPLAPKPVASGRPGALDDDEAGEDDAAAQETASAEAPAVSVPPVTPTEE